MESQASTQARAQLTTVVVFTERSHYTFRLVGYDEYLDLFEWAGKPHLFDEELMEEQRGMWFSEDWTQRFQDKLGDWYNQAQRAKGADPKAKVVTGSSGKFSLGLDEEDASGGEEIASASRSDVGPSQSSAISTRTARRLHQNVDRQLIIVARRGEEGDSERTRGLGRFSISVFCSLLKNNLVNID